MKLFISEIKKYKRHILNLFLAFISYLAILIYFKIIFSNDSYNFLLLVLFFLLFAFFNKYLEKYKKLDKRIRLFSLILSIILSVILTLGSLVSSYTYQPTGLIFNFHRVIYLIVGIIGFSLLFKIPIGFILKKGPIVSTDENRKMSKKGFWSIGTMVIILIISTCILLYKKQGKYLLAYIPLYCLWLSLMLASPVFAELRYIYGLFACMPLLICVPLLKSSRYKRGNNGKD